MITTTIPGWSAERLPEERIASVWTNATIGAATGGRVSGAPVTTFWEGDRRVTFCSGSSKTEAELSTMCAIHITSNITGQRRAAPLRGRNWSRSADHADRQEERRPDAYGWRPPKSGHYGSEVLQATISEKSEIHGAAARLPGRYGGENL